MRILYLTHRLPYAPNRGDRIRAHYTLRHLAPRHEVDVVSFVHDDEEAARAADLSGIAASVTTFRIRAARKAIGVFGALAGGRTVTHGILDAPGFDRRLEALLRARRHDLVLAYCSGMARFALRPPLARVPMVLDMVDVDSGKWDALAAGGRGPRHWLYRREAALLRDFERTATDAAMATLVVNERERTSLRSICPSARIDVVENGIDVDMWRTPGLPSAEPRVVFCGVMNYEPNETAALWFAREVWPLVRKARPDAMLTLVGANPTRRLMGLPQMDASIEVTGSVADVRAFLWRAAVSVAPLLVARGLQNKVLEASAAGLPSVVTTAVADGLPRDVRAACTVADTASVFSAAVLGLLSMPPAQRAAIAARANLEAIDWSRTLAPLDAILATAAASTEQVA